jgi:hypothetical protein
MPQPRSVLPDADGQWVRRWTGEDWFAEADGWVRDRLAASGIVVSGEPVPYKIRFWAAVWCYPTDHGLFWFKENNPGQAFEAALVGAMAQALPQDVVAPLAIDPAGPFRFFDFGDAVWGHPFTTLGSVREDVDDAVVTAYLENWTDLAPLDVLRNELEIAEPLHAVHRMVSWHRLLQHADEIECAAWVENVQYWLGELVRTYGSTSAD